MRAITCSTCSIVSAVTNSGRLSTRDTVIGETPASFATSPSVTLPVERLEFRAREGERPFRVAVRTEDVEAERRILDLRWTDLMVTLSWRMLKRKPSVPFRSESWRNTIESQGEDTLELLDENPSLRREATDRLDRAYRKAKPAAPAETGMSKERFPKDSPFSLEQALDETFWPT